MPIYIYWGDDDYLIERSINLLRDTVVHPEWQIFNFSRYQFGEDNFRAARNDILTPPMGEGGRLVLLSNLGEFKAIDETKIEQLSRTLVNIPDSNHLLLTSKSKLDNRLKFTKLISQYAQVKEFSLIPAWDTQKLTNRVKEVSRELSISISDEAANLLAVSVGNNTRLLFNELEKLSLVAVDSEVEVYLMKSLVSIATTNTLQLAKAICVKDVSTATQVFTTLLSQNESIVKIVATLTTSFRTWLIVKAMVAEGVLDNYTIATAAGVGNPNRVYYLKQEISAISISRLKQVLYQLLELEILAKLGATESLFTSHIISLCTA
ncbi:DNA polymerase III subunit delta [Planktothrix sp. FACHB-1355]|uniref:DNA polymerase III subunit delta n=1 Tax=Planktothrix sp. FACHB-1355 TaxID=2692854 RepID=UPI00168BC698|nr:DNA polymerase III subunit delta [Planktothrix sp. FACHB-1355]MBD3557574.1 DNA polymerase III subunit delta [Planktothrix sp. FACHB-1355]